ncbi:MAG TPA: DJ-1 family protein, partial [Gammaproteobacteria bacterium]|nr:DJ-1 family protein [Gammaproteobacteria bacterium]
RAGLLEKHKATAYPGALEPLKLDSVELSADPVVVDDKIITSRGPGTAMDFALTLIEQLVSRQKREEVEKPLCRPDAPSAYQAYGS